MAVLTVLEETNDGYRCELHLSREEKIELCDKGPGITTQCIDILLSIREGLESET